MANTDIEARGADDRDALLDAIEEFESALSAWGDYSPYAAVRAMALNVRGELEDLRTVIDGVQPDPDPALREE